MIYYINKEKLINSFEYNDDDSFEDERNDLIDALSECSSIEELSREFPDEYQFYLITYSKYFSVDDDYDDILFNIIFDGDLE